MDALPTCRWSGSAPESPRGLVRGYGRANLYRIDERTFLVRDADSSYTVSLADSGVTKDPDRRRAGAFVGSFDIDQTKTWRFISVDEREEQETELHGG